MRDFMRNYGILVAGGFLMMRGFGAFIALMGWIMRTHGFEAAIQAFICLFSLIILLVTRLSDY